MTVEHHEFASDNTAPICPEAWAALQEANTDYAAAYGEDRWTARVYDRIREIFETDCDVYFVFTGTAANALALAQVCQSFRSIICHQNAHIQTDECGAPEFFTGGSKLLPVGGGNGKIDIGQTKALLIRQNDLHSHKPGVISIAQATEFGTVYTPDEIAAVAGLARAYQLFVHMDGARFANAVASLNCSPKTITWEVGVDVLCFGGTKNGTGAGELVIFFNKEVSREFDYRTKQAGQLGSKMRFLAASWIGLLTGTYGSGMPSTRTVPHVTLRGACKVCRRSRLSFPWRQMQCLFDWMTKSHAASRRADGVFTNLSSPMFTA